MRGMAIGAAALLLVACDGGTIPGGGGDDPVVEVSSTARSLEAQVAAHDTIVRTRPAASEFMVSRLNVELVAIPKPVVRAGSTRENLITAVDGEKVKTSRELTAKAATLPVGDTTKITVLRDGKEKTFDVKVAKRPLTVADAGRPQVEKEGEYGLQVTDLTPEMAQRLKTSRETGVVVVGVRPDSKAYKAGVEQGDLILEVNRQAVSSTGELKQLLAKHKGGEGISLLVQRPNAGMMVLKMA